MDGLFNIGGKEGGEMKNMMKGIPEDMAKKASNLWKFLDDLAESDPEGYKKFLDEQGKAAESAKKEEDAVSPVEGAAPMAIVETLVSGQDVPKGSCALIHLWRGKKGMPEATVDGGKPVSVGTTAWSGVAIPFCQLRQVAVTPLKKSDIVAPGQQAASSSDAALQQFHLIVGPKTMVLLVSGSPSELRTLVTHAACQFVERMYPVAISKQHRVLKIDSTCLPNKAPDAASAANLAVQGTAAEGLSKGLLGELASMGLSDTTDKRSPAVGANMFGGKQPQRPKAPLIQEISSGPTPSTDKAPPAASAPVAEAPAESAGACVPESSAAFQVPAGSATVAKSAPRADDPSSYILQVQMSRTVSGVETVTIEAIFRAASRAADIDVELDGPTRVVMTLNPSKGCSDPPLVAQLPCVVAEEHEVMAKFDKKSKTLMVAFLKVPKKKADQVPTTGLAPSGCGLDVAPPSSSRCDCLTD